MFSSSLGMFRSERPLNRSAILIEYCALLACCMMVCGSLRYDKVLVVRNVTAGMLGWGCEAGMVPAAIKVATDVSCQLEDFFEIHHICDLPKTKSDKFIYNQLQKCDNDFHKTSLPL